MIDVPVIDTQAAEAKPAEHFILPIGKYLLIEVIPDVETFAGGLLMLPEGHSPDAPQKANVLATGNGGFSGRGAPLPMDVKPGDQIFFGRNYGTDIRAGEMLLKIINIEDVIAVIEETSDEA